MIVLKKILNWLSKPKPFLLDEKYRIVPAFEFKGDVYYTFEDPLNIATGRGLSFMQVNEEIMMRCDIEYLKSHIEAVKKVIGNPKTIDLPQLLKLYNNLEERVNLLIALPDHVFKAAAVVYFTKDESPYKYDRVAGMRKIDSWKKAEGMYDFFLQGRLDRLIPSLEVPEEGTKRYLELVETIHQMHLREIRKVLSPAKQTEGVRS